MYYIYICKLRIIRSAAYFAHIIYFFDIISTASNTTSSSYSSTTMAYIDFNILSLLNYSRYICYRTGMGYNIWSYYNSYWYCLYWNYINK